MNDEMGREQIEARRNSNYYDEHATSTYITIGSSASSRGYSPKMRPVVVHKPSGPNTDDEPRSSDVIHSNVRR